MKSQHGTVMEDSPPPREKGPDAQMIPADWEALPERMVSEQGVPILFDDADRELVDPKEQPPAAGLDLFRLSLRAAKVASYPGFDRLISLPMVRDMQVLEHQTRTARTVLQRMRGRAMLCDEVGLGKTVEAGLILSELIYRGLARNVLVLTPPSLVEQWQGELGRKFSQSFITHDDPDFRAAGPDAWGAYDRILASYHTAKRSPHREAILDRQWDAVIIDEAHHLRNSRTQLWKFASQLSKRFTLLLTATPVQNHLDELFNLVTLLEPGLLSTAKGFQRRFVDRKDKLNPKNVEELHELLTEVMVRNRRSTVGLGFTRRYARTEQLHCGGQERKLYDQVTALVREQLGQTGGGSGNGKGGRSISRMALLSLQMQMGSSSDAAAPTLWKLSERDRLDPEVRARLTDLARAADATDSNVKADRLLEVIDELSEKLVVFTQFRGTQQMLKRRLEQAGVESAVFHGGLGRLEKERQIERFRGPARVLLTTDSGSEGRNLQFCNAICNFDLPWNPMRIEQRIGRLSRIGQARDVHVINLVAAETIEATILHLLEAKLAMFEMVVGEIDMVLGNLDQEQDFSDLIVDLWSQSSGMEDFAHRMEQLGDRMVAAKEDYAQQKAIEDRIFGDRFRPE